MKIEITEKLILKEDENWAVYLHSFYNIIQVLYNDVNILKKVLGDSQNIHNLLKSIDELKVALSDPQQTFNSLGNLNNFKSYMFKEIDTAIMNAGEFEKTQLVYLEKALVSLDEIVRVAVARSEEFLEFITHKTEWISFDTVILADKLRDVLMAMPARSTRNYGITFDKSIKEPNDYYFCLDFSPDTAEIELPVLFPDIIRDLAANAKKYSTPGDTITCRLQKEDDIIRFAIHDNGRGIPENEIKNTVKFGVRASNVTEEETLGNGFGLTKAYLITSEHNGKMWIDSVLGEYTEITIELPIPH